MRWRYAPRVTRLAYAARRDFFAVLRAVLRAGLRTLRAVLRAVVFLATALRAGAFLTFRFTALLAIVFSLSVFLSLSCSGESRRNKKMMRKFQDFVDSKLQIKCCDRLIQEKVLREILNFLMFRMLWVIIRTFRLHFQATLATSDAQTIFANLFRRSS
jgi:hypothetical protein